MKICCIAEQVYFNKRKKFIIKTLLQELEEVYSDLCSTVTEAIIQGAEVVSNRVSIIFLPLY